MNDWLAYRFCWAAAGGRDRVVVFLQSRTPCIDQADGQPASPVRAKKVYVIVSRRDNVNGNENKQLCGRGGGGWGSESPSLLWYSVIRSAGPGDDEMRRVMTDKRTDDDGWTDKLCLFNSRSIVMRGCQSVWDWDRMGCVVSIECGPRRRQRRRTDDICWSYKTSIGHAKWWANIN